MMHRVHREHRSLHPGAANCSTLSRGSDTVILTSKANISSAISSTPRILMSQRVLLLELSVTPPPAARPPTVARHPPADTR
ncbi:hypothetical protein EVAR_30857_1 [Eumeta japonica]|uniref:Uncharacterized protein n=1 Tax=Eumeta variegata TaxID=151549 RepID=A0A4C1XUC1_EUMVA|nr:hypothetical protein EVAR_30857_1 [Eumeta japonica]